jgi:bifunctional non-homologous end joining protein LigD
MMTRPTFIKPQLPHDLDDAGVGLGDPHFIAEPKLDGHRGQIHVVARKAAAVFTRGGHDIVASKGLKWLREASFPASDMILDVEMYGGQGTNLEGASAAHHRAAGHLSIGIFDLLHHNGESLLRKTPWIDRRERLDSIFKGTRWNVLPFTTDHDLLWREWVVKHKGEGIVLKRIDSLYVPGHRTWGWLRLKAEQTVDVIITGISSKPSYAREYRTGEAALTFGFWDPATRTVVNVGQGLKVGTRGALEAFVGKVAELRCNGIAENGALRHHRFIRWRDDKVLADCTLPKLK